MEGTLTPVEVGQVIKPRLGLLAVPEITHQIYCMSLDGALGKQTKPATNGVGTGVLQIRSETKPAGWARR